MGKAIAICNQKGGVGKTVTTVNLGIGLARQGKRVLLVDVDPQGSMTASLGYQHPDQLEETLATVLGKVIEDEPLAPGEGILHQEEGVDLLPANIDLAAMEVTLVNIMSRETVKDGRTVTEFVDGEAKRTFQAEEGSSSFAVTGETFMKLLDGPHTMCIRANDGKITATHERTFTKLVTAASVTLAGPMAADEAITLCALSVSGGIPADAAFKVEVTNNANDESPAWEDCTTAVRNRLNHIFENKTAANGFAFNFRLHVERGESGQGGYITSIQGGFQ